MEKVWIQLLVSLPAIIIAVTGLVVALRSKKEVQAVANRTLELAELTAKRRAVDEDFD